MHKGSMLKKGGGEISLASPPSLSSSNTSVASMQEVERPVQRGLKKSTAFHDASLL